MLAVSERGNEHILGSPGRERQGLFLRKGSTARGTANSVKAAVVVNDALSRAALQCCSVLAGSGSLPARSARLQRLIFQEQIPKSLASMKDSRRELAQPWLCGAPAEAEIPVSRPAQCCACLPLPSMCRIPPPAASIAASHLLLPPGRRSAAVITAALHKLLSSCAPHC